MRAEDIDRLQLLCHAYRTGVLSDRECRWALLDALFKLPEPQVYVLVEEWLRQGGPDSTQEDGHD